MEGPTMRVGGGGKYRPSELLEESWLFSDDPESYLLSPLGEHKHPELRVLKALLVAEVSPRIVIDVPVDGRGVEEGQRITTLGTMNGATLYLFFLPDPSDWKSAVYLGGIGWSDIPEHGIEDWLQALLLSWAEETRDDAEALQDQAEEKKREAEQLETALALLIAD